MDPETIVKDIIREIKTRKSSVVERIVPANIKDKVIALIGNYNYYASWYDTSGTNVLIYVLC